MKIKDIKIMYDTIELNDFKEINVIDKRLEPYGGVIGAIEFFKENNMPLPEGYFCIKDYDISSVFKFVGNIFGFTLYIHSGNEVFPVYKYSIDLTTMESKKKVIGGQNRKFLSILEKEDDTLLKQFKMLMLVLYYMAVYKYEPIEVKNIVSKKTERTLRQAFLYRKVPLVTKQYIVTPSDDVQKKRKPITCPCWSVRGHYRHYKTGKTVWVSPYTKGKERGKIEPKKRVYSGI